MNPWKPISKNFIFREENKKFINSTRLGKEVRYHIFRQAISAGKADLL